MTKLNALVIATASGEPLHSLRPKPIHLLCGRPMVSYVLTALADAGAMTAAVVTGSDGTWIARRVLAEPSPLTLRFVDRGNARGNAEAALVGLSALDDVDGDAEDGDVLILPADLPLLRAEVLRSMIEAHRAEGAACTVLVAPENEAPVDASGRIVFDKRGNCVAITNSPGRVGEGMTIGPAALGVFIVRRELLAPVLRRVTPDPFDRQASLDVMVEVVADTGHRTALVEASNLDDVRPVDSRIHLAEAEAELRRRTNDYWMRRGVTMVDPSQTYIDTTVLLGRDVTLFPGTMLQGSTVIGDRSQLGPNTRLIDCQVGADVIVETTSGRSAVIGDDCAVGPYAVLGPGSILREATVTGPFYAAKTADL